MSKFIEDVDIKQITTMIKDQMSSEDMVSVLNSIYEKTLEGIPKVGSSVDSLAAEYLKRYEDPKLAANKMINYQVLKTTVSGGLSGLGGVVSLPVTLPANIVSVLYVQLRMIACVAKLAGYDLSEDAVQSFVYACLGGISVNSVIKNAGGEFGKKFAISMIKKIPGDVIKDINKKVGFRLVTKFGSKGVVNLGKLVPGVGAVIGGGMDFLETRIIGDRAIKMFFEGNDVTSVK